MDADFWGLLIVPGKKYSNESHKPIRVTTACFGEKVVKGSSTCVYLQINDNEFALCKLSESKNESQSLDTYLPTDSEFSFRVSGPNEVHLTGHIVDAPESEDDYDQDDDDDEDELMQKFMRGEMGSDLDDESFEGSDSDASLEEANIEEIDEESEDETPKSKKGAVTKAPEKNITPAPIESATPSKEADATIDLSKLSKRQRKALKKQAEKAAQPEAVKVQEKRKADDIKSAEPKSENKKPKVDSKQQKASEAKPNTDKPSIITHPNGLIVEDKTVGTGAVAKRGSKVSMRYIGKLKNGKVFDRNTSGPAFSFKLGAGQVIRGWDLGIEGMKIGGERRLVIPAPLGYGKKGAAPDIPGNATLEFDVKLLAVK